MHVRTGYERGNLGVKFIIVLLFMQYRDKRMDLKRLRTFAVVADLGTVSKAALRLHISQSCYGPTVTS
jgi:hypothetical protein